MSDHNTPVIEEFRASGGKVAAWGEDATMLLLHTTGAKSGAERVTPMMYKLDGDRVFVFASKAGAPTNPDWYHNLVAHPEVTVEMGTETFSAIATPLPEAERKQVYDKQAAVNPAFSAFQEKTTRPIPVVEITRVG